MTTWYATNALLTTHQEMSETSPGADASSSPATGWTVGTTAATVRASFDANTMVTAATFSGTTQPDGTLVTTAGAGDALRTTNTYNGSFATGTWALNFRAIGAVASGAGRIYFRLLRGANADGSGATEFTAGSTAGGIVSLAASQFTSTGTTASVTGFSVTNEYIFCQLAWEITTAGGMSTNTVQMRVGTTATILTSPTFTATVVPQVPVTYTPQNLFAY